MRCDPNFWVVGSQLATPIVVALLGAYFAWQQTRTARSKLRLDHFDKRYAVFNAARDFVGKALALGGVKIEDEQAFVIGTLGAGFILSQDLARYLDDMHRRVIDMSFIQGEMADAASDEDRTQLKEKYLVERRWLREQADVLAQKFKPFLQLSG